MRPRATFNRAERYVEHDQRETVPILVRPRDDGDDHGDSGMISDRAERLSLTFATPMMDRCSAGLRRRHSIRSNNTGIKSKYTRHANLEQ